MYSSLSFMSWRRGALVSVVAALALAGCGGGGGGGGGMGTLNVSMTDAPACGYDHVYVTVQKVRVNASASATDSDGGWSDIVLNPAQRFDLLALSNGVLANLGQTPLAAGHYSQIRLVLATNGNSAPFANSVVPTGGSEVALTTPSGQQTGIKLNADITIAANQMADFVLDFNACKSVVAAGASGNYLLKPVIAVTPNYVSGVSGYVDATVANGNTLVTVQQGGIVVKATAPDATGKFVLEPVAPGSYDVVITAPNRTSTVITAVPVASQTITALNTSSTPLVPVAALDGTASGTITTTPPSSTIDATVGATQKLTNGDTIDVADTAANSVTGAYSLTLPAAAPMVASYVVSPAAYSFGADATAGVKYTLSATSGGVVQTTASPITITAGGTVTTNFGF